VTSPYEQHLPGDDRPERLSPTRDVDQHDLVQLTTLLFMTYLAYCECSVYRQVTALLDATPHDPFCFLALPAGRRNATLHAQSAQPRRSANACIADVPLATTKSGA
jgi:hypothetical protein